MVRQLKICVHGAGKPYLKYIQVYETSVLKHQLDSTYLTHLLTRSLVTGARGWGWGWGGWGVDLLVDLQSTMVDVDTLWNKAEKIPCEKLHKKFMNIYLGVQSKVSNTAVRGGMGRFPLVVTIIKAMLNFWLHVEDIADMNALANAAMKKALLIEDVQITWFYSSKQIQYSLFGKTWTGQAPGRQQLQVWLMISKKLCSPLERLPQ